MVIKVDESVFIRGIQGCLLRKLYEAVRKHIEEKIQITSPKAANIATTEITTETHDLPDQNLIAEENEGKFIIFFSIFKIFGLRRILKRTFLLSCTFKHIV